MNNVMISLQITYNQNILFFKNISGNSTKILHDVGLIDKFVNEEEIVEDYTICDKNKKEK